MIVMRLIQVKFKFFEFKIIILALFKDTGGEGERFKNQTSPFLNLSTLFETLWTAECIVNQGKRERERERKGLKSYSNVMKTYQAIQVDN